MLDAFNDLAKVTRLYILSANPYARIDVPCVHHNPAWEGQTIPVYKEAASSVRPGTLAASQSSAPTLKRGRPLGIKMR
ncbi:hypothetical protein ACFX2K_044274 [Malus domestica]